MLQAELLYSDTNTIRFEWIKRLECIGVPFLNLAEVALPSAQLAHDHEGRCVVRPALSDVRALRLFAYGVQIECLNNFAGL